MRDQRGIGSWTVMPRGMGGPTYRFESSPAPESEEGEWTSQRTSSSRYRLMINDVEAEGAVQNRRNNAQRGRGLYPVAGRKRPREESMLDVSDCTLFLNLCDA